ncbi:MAG: hypothetical protein IPK16_28070 [Anaerolineales bacterium]|nr:hypothetical protein [Anaerolineales bacterium]
MAQELGHNYGREHVDCGNPDDIDGSYPYPPCQIGDAGQDKYYGFDTRARTPIAPTAAADFMSYGNRTWVSDYTWRALLNSFAGMGAPSVQPTLVNAGEVVYAAGYIDMAINQGKLNSLLVLPPASVPPQTLAGAMQPANVAHGDEPLATYRLRLLDAANAVLHEEVLAPVLMDDHSETSNPALFSTTFVAPAGTVAKVQLLADAAVIETLKVGSGKPTVTVQKPVSSEAVDAGLAVAWTAHDPNPADTLRFTVQYSYDNGGHWHTLATDLAGAPDGKNTFAIADLGSLHGSNGNSARMRILASDGYNTGIGLSAPFTVANRKPDVALFAPVAGQSIPAAIPVLLSGAATDAEDGGLGDAALTWQVDGASVGAGRDLAVYGLAPGHIPPRSPPPTQPAMHARSRPVSRSHRSAFHSRWRRCWMASAMTTPMPPALMLPLRLMAMVRRRMYASCVREMPCGPASAVWNSAPRRPAPLPGCGSMWTTAGMPRHSQLTTASLPAKTATSSRSRVTAAVVLRHRVPAD